VREYVRALDKRDRAAFCATLAPWVQAKVGAALRDGFVGGAAAATPDTELCKQGAGFIGYFGENVDTRWASATIVHMERPRPQGPFAVVDMRVRNHYSSTGYATGPKARPDRMQRDRVYLLNLGGRWLIAKLSAVADSATIGLLDKTDALTPPDLTAEQAELQRRIDTSNAARDQSRATAGHPYTDCSTVARVRSISDGAGDVGGVLRPVDLPSVDLREVSVAESADHICFDFVTAGPVKPPIAMVVNLSEPAGPSSPGFTLDVVLTKPGQAFLGVSSDQRALDGQVGVSGNHMSAVIARDQFPPQFRGVLDRFDWTAQSVYHPPESKHRHISQFDDRAPNSPNPPSHYP
jgi:hypothetical protein